MVHGDDWKYGKDKDLRQKAINSLRKVGGKLIEIPFTRNISSSAIQERIYQQGTTTSNRQIILQRLLEVKNICNAAWTTDVKAAWKAHLIASKDS